MYCYVNGNKYDGEWKEDKICGKGKENCKNLGILYYNTGDRYEGEWQDNKKNGRGTFNL